jgi:hypothetical protein
MLEISSASHLDHGLSTAHVAWILAQFPDASAFMIATLELPPELAPVVCALYGPAMGDDPVTEGFVRYVVRGSRQCATRAVSRPVRTTRKLTIIAGPSVDRPCVLYTSYGGPAAPREPGDPSIASWDELQASRAFWQAHALALATTETP